MPINDRKNCGDYIHKHNLNTNEEALEKLLINDQEVIH